MARVPVRVYRNGATTPGNKLTNLSEFAPRVIPDARLTTDGYVPANLAPSNMFPDYLLDEDRAREWLARQT